MENTPIMTTDSLKQQLHKRIELMKEKARKAQETSDQEHFNRVFNDPDAWETVASRRNNGSILPQ